MKTTSNNTESKNGMNKVTIDFRPQVRHQEGFGREVLADIYFRIDIHDYVANLYNYTQEANDASKKAVAAFYDEVVKVLTAEGWALKNEKYGPGNCPQLKKGAQYLYCHPQQISGHVKIEDIETLEAKFKAMTSCRYYATDNYGDIIVTTSADDEKQLYRDQYAEGLTEVWKEFITTKRRDLYKDKKVVEHYIAQCISIQNNRIDRLNGTDNYNMRNPLLEFVCEEYDRLLQAGYIKETQGLYDGRTLCRWINKTEEKKLKKVA